MSLTTQEIVNNVYLSGMRNFHGRIPATVQRELFGQYFGKGQVHIDLDAGEIVHCVSVCFGTDSSETGGIRIAESGLSHEIWTSR